MRALLGAGLLGLGMVAAASDDARACGNEVEIQLTPVQHIAQAESFVEHGQAGLAASIVRAQYPNIRTLDEKAEPLALRAERIYAMALVRANGQLDGQIGWTRAANFEWAIETLKAIDAKRPNEPRIQADLAEAGLRVNRTRSSSMARLEDLDQRDLLGSAFAYLALARARDASGDTGGAQAALRRCHAMSSDRAQCEMKGGWFG